jgi:threonine dehydrogenase-like Zn-dependent dehydrogenase
MNWALPVRQFPTGYMAEFCNTQDGDTIAIWGCGPVGQMAIRSAFLLGAGTVIAIDTVPERVALARAAGAVTLDHIQDDVYDRILEMTSGRGADAASMRSGPSRIQRRERRCARPGQGRHRSRH